MEVHVILLFDVKCIIMPCSSPWYALYVSVLILVNFLSYFFIQTFYQTFLFKHLSKGNIAVAINAATLALINAGISMRVWLNLIDSFRIFSCRHTPYLKLVHPTPFTCSLCLHCSFLLNLNQPCLFLRIMPALVLSAILVVRLFLVRRWSDGVEDLKGRR